jgi:copper homeostasis protein
VRPLVEICVDSVDGALAAERAGADRIELCAGLVEGGTTPSIGTIRVAVETVRRAGVQVLIRPRGGDFLYSAAEVEAMLADIEAVRALASDVGFVLGALTPNGEVDVETTARLIEACGAAPVTFHKAFDLTRDLTRSLEALISLGVGRVLTSGGRPHAVDGAAMLARLVQLAGTRIRVLIGGGVRAANVAHLLAETGAQEVHLRAARTVGSPMRYRREGMTVSAARLPPDHTLTVTSTDEVHAVLRAVDVR